MIQSSTYLESADNTGAKKLYCIKVLGGSGRKYARLGDVVVVSVKEAIPSARVNKGTVHKAVIVRVKKEQRRVDIDFSKNEEFYFFEVKDNGKGIPKEKFEEIFDLFTTLDTADREGSLGSGIGLATVKKLIESMGGSISLESEVGKGSIFKFCIKRF